jgi:DNA primase
MQFSRNFPDQLRSQITTSDVVSKKVILKKKGKEYSGLCPFHTEKSPSFTVNDQKGFFHCFGCGEHGDIFGFTMKMEGLDFKSAVLKLANDHSIFVPIVENEEREQEQQDKINKELLLLETACQFFKNNLFTNSGNQALQYLYKRGLNNSQIKKFHLGFALNNYESLRNYLITKGFSQLELMSSGIISQNDNGTYDKFRNRIIFPISNSQGQIIAFGGRVLDDKQPKYLNSSETNLFKKGQNLYNFSSAKKAIYDNKSVIIVEGYMDAILLSINNIENVVAPLGTAITISQLQILFRVCGDIVICLDGDKAGIGATQRVIELVLPIINSKNLIRFAFLPDELDPDDFVRKNGSMAMQDLLKNAKHLSQTLFDFEAKNLNISQAENRILPEKKSQLEAKLYQKIDLITDANSKKHFAQFYKNLLFWLGKNQNSTKKFGINDQKIIPKKLLIADEFDKQDKYSIFIIALLISFPQLMEYQDEFCVLRNLEFKNQNLANIKDCVIDLFDKNNNDNLDEIKCELENLCDEDVRYKILPQIFAVISVNKSSMIKDLEAAKKKLQILLLQYFYEGINEQYNQIIVTTDYIQTDETTLTTKKERDFFEYKAKLEKKILALIEEF